MILTTFKSVSRAYIDDPLMVFDGEWTDIVDLLTEYRFANKKEDVPLFNMCAFMELGDPDAELGRKQLWAHGEWTGEYEYFANTVRRCRDNIIELHGLVLDIDGTMTIEQAVERYMGLEMVLYTTWSHTADKHCFRVVIPFSQPLLAKDIAGRLNSMKETFPEVDNASFSGSQSFYFHCGDNDPQAYYIPGAMIDPYEFEEEIVIEEFYIVPTDVKDVTDTISELRNLYPTLTYEQWIRVTWAYCNELGYNEGIALMSAYYPEKSKGEYAKLKTSKPPARRCGIGTIRKMIKDRQPTDLTGMYSAAEQRMIEMRKRLAKWQ